MQLLEPLLQTRGVRADLAGHPQPGGLRERPELRRGVDVEQAHVEQRAGVAVPQFRGQRGHVVEVGAERRPHRVHRADSRVPDGVDGGDAVLRSQRVVGVVDDGRDAGVECGESRGERAGIDVTRGVGRAEAERGESEVGREVGGRGEPAQLSLPGVDVGVDEAGDRDRPPAVDHLDARRGRVEQPGADGDDDAVADDDVAVLDDADRRIDADDGGVVHEQRGAGTGRSRCRLGEWRGHGGSFPGRWTHRGRPPLPHSWPAAASAGGPHQDPEGSVRIPGCCATASSAR